MTIGCSKILFGAHIIVYIFVGCFVAAFLAALLAAFLAVWVCVGVHTHTHTHIHTHTHTHTQAAEGFGILTVASVCPIISVLCVSGYSQYKRSQAAASDAHSRMA